MKGWCIAPLLIWAAMILSSPRCMAQDEVRQTAQEVFAQANQHFAQATSRRATDEEAARDEYAQAIALYRSLIDDYGFHSSGLYYNIANAHALSGDVGRAIANYRRAQRLSPSEAQILANLSATRARVTTAIEQTGSRRLLRTLLAPHYDTPSRTRLWLACFALLLGWTGLLLRLQTNPPPFAPRGLIVGCFLVGLMAGASLIIEDRTRHTRQEAVVIADSIVGRKGPDERGYEPSFTRPLTAGVEAQVVETRADWVLVRLRDGRETWLPAAAVEVI